jgi:hypothetical protein
MLWYGVLIQYGFGGTKVEPSTSCMKTRILAGLLVAAALATAPGVALARGSHRGGFHGGGGDFHGGGGFHDGSFHGRGDFHGGFTHHGFVPDQGRFRHGHDRFFGHSFAFGVPWPGYYDPYYVYDYRYGNYTAADSSDVILAVQRALAQLGYYHGPVDGVVGPQTERAIRWFQSADSLPVTGAIDSATLRALRIG